MWKTGAEQTKCKTRGGVSEETMKDPLLLGLPADVKDINVGAGGD